MSETKLKIGDMAVVTACIYGHEFAIGETVTVVEIEDDNSHYCVNSKGENWHLEPCELGDSLQAAAPAMYAKLKEIAESMDKFGFESTASEIYELLAAARGETKQSQP